MGPSSKHFSDKELACKCCGQNKVKFYLIQKLEELRAKLGKPIVVTNAYRCPKHNREVGGKANSQHLLGRAADIKVAGVSPTEVAKAAEEVGFNGIGIYPTFTHVDVRARKARWNG